MQSRYNTSPHRRRPSVCISIHTNLSEFFFFLHVCVVACLDRYSTSTPCCFFFHMDISTRHDVSRKILVSCNMICICMSYVPTKKKKSLRACIQCHMYICHKIRIARTHIHNWLSVTWKNENCCLWRRCHRTFDCVSMGLVWTRRDVSRARAMSCIQ